MMGVREWMNQHRGVTIGIGVAIVVVAVGAIVAQVLANRKAYPSALPDSYFTADDGKTFFVANSENIPPFDYKHPVTGQSLANIPEPPDDVVGRK